MKSPILRRLKNFNLYVHDFSQANANRKRILKSPFFKGDFHVTAQVEKLMNRISINVESPFIPGT